MAGVMAYAAVHARVRAMYATMLTPETWSRLCDAPDLAATINVLKETIYGPHLTAVAEAALTARRAVYQIKGHLAEVCLAVIHSVPRQAHPLLVQMYRLFEVDNLKAVLRGTIAGASWDRVRYVLFPLGPLNVLPAQAMVESGSVSAAVEQLRGTPYYDTLSHAMERYTAEQSLFPLEVALDLEYWRELWRDIHQLSGQDREQAMRLVGSLVDMNNLTWAIRYRVYHQLSEEEIINYTLPFGYRVQDEEIRAIAAGADISQVIERIYPELTDPATLIEGSRGGLSRLERQLQRLIAEKCRSAFAGYPFHIGIPLAYVLLCELEIQDLTVLIEAKAAQLPAEGYQPFLVLGCTPEAQPIG
jgi:V/A-type H+-transporting ATPase subunit C